MVALTVPSPFPHHARHPRHEERQQEEDDGVAEGVAHAVVEELHPRLGPEEFRGNGHRRDGMYASCTLSKSRLGRYGSLIRELWILLR